MTVQKAISPGSLVVGVPVPNRTVQNLMLATATAFGEVVETEPGRFDPLLEGCFVLTKTGILLAGTACRRPLVMPEFATLCAATGRDGIMVRACNVLEPGKSTFDVNLAGSSGTLAAYRLWLSDVAYGSAWLVPSTIEPSYIRVGEAGLEIHESPPFQCERHRGSGLARGARLLSLVGEGWY